MTLGKKLSKLRKVTGMTQQQLGEKLNLSPQAISKWENDLAEPDLATLRSLAGLYHVSIDALLDPDNEFPVTADDDIPESEPEEEKPDKEEKEEVQPPITIGFCKECGITVTEENLGEKTPFVLCRNCVAKREREKQKKIDDAARKKRYNSAVMRKTRKNSLIVAGLVTLAALVYLIVSQVREFNTTLLISGIFGLYVIFAFVASLFYESPVRDVIFWMLSRSIRWPGLIFTFDMDGFLWLIGMKILFGILGFLFGVVMAILGIAFGMVTSVFVFPYLLVRTHNDIVNGTISD